MNASVNLTQKDFLLRLREIRPELAEFLLRCERQLRPEPAASFVRRHLAFIAAAGEAQGHPVLAENAQAVMSALDRWEDIIPLINSLRLLLDAALQALTFKAYAHDKPFPVPVAFSGYPAARKPRLVIADDDRIVREMMKQIFAQATELYSAEHGKQALELIERHMPDLVILDDFMPEMTGMRLLDTLQVSALFSSIPVIMLTGSDRERDRLRAMDAGAAAYMLKPFNPCDLIETARKILDRSLVSSHNQ